MKRREYQDYREYLKHQRRKAANPIVVAKVCGRFEKDMARFVGRFKEMGDIVPPGSRILCLGARFGAEVAALYRCGYQAIGIDLVPHPPLVIEGDFHAIPFPDHSFNAIYTNAVDHVFDLDRFSDEIRRVLTPKAWLVVTLHPDDWGNYESIQVGQADFTALFPMFQVVQAFTTGKTLTKVHLVMYRDGDKDDGQWEWQIGLDRV